MIEAAVAMTTTNSELEAKKLAGGLVKDKLAACVQILPKMHSIYEWDGEIHDDQEYLLLIKTRKELLKDVKKFIEKNHSYEVPEFVALPVVDALGAYL
ncbi:MAG: divalent-cation tolerance protein CutA, partial [Pseudomonadota bacterium]